MISKSISYLFLMIRILFHSISELSLDSTLHAINLHCNNISKIEAIDHVWNLQHLDLSSNQISQIEGLSTLTKLRTLNLSCNLITRIEGLWFSCNLLNKENHLSPFIFPPKRMGWILNVWKLTQIYYIKFLLLEKLPVFLEYFVKYQ